jgi:hypothetical protein
MANWLIEHFLWVAIALAVVLVGLKVVLGAVFKRLMDQSAAAAASRQDD